MWYVDVGYHIASTLAVEDRRESDASRSGTISIAWSNSALNVRRGTRPGKPLSRGIVHGFFLWGITTQVEAGLIEILLHRMGTAAADHDAFARAISDLE